jgi:hypothetical protein
MVESNSNYEVFEKSQEGSAKSAEFLISDANSNRSNLIAQQKEQTDYLKQGGKSGITNEFGKPSFYDSGENNSAGKQGHEKNNPDHRPAINEKEPNDVKAPPKAENAQQDMTRSFEYDQQHKLNGFEENGQHWSRQNNGSFVKDGSHPPEIRTNVQLSQDTGAFSYKDQTTGQQIIENVSGYKSISYPGQYIIDTDASGRIERVVTPPGPQLCERQFEYDQNSGQLNGFSENGAHWSKKEDGSFVKDGSNPLERRTNLKIDPDGSFTWKDPVTGDTHGQLPDGTTGLMHPDGSYIIRNKDGEPITEHTPSHIVVPPSGGL